KNNVINNGITIFFNSGSIGVFANASGGYKATLAVPAIFGFLEIIVIALGLGMIYSFGIKSSGLVASAANSKEAVEYLTHGPFFTGFNGMFDWN
ncbi:PTS transporter subunit IIC, partial [Mycoplasmopsis bovis]|uniref:PTS transporter subunit IIC n=1 Tax=Mycoplasmopsis bovis TaxID=28903 RepID=UPI003D29A444